MLSRRASAIWAGAVVAAAVATTLVVRLRQIEELSLVTGVVLVARSRAPATKGPHLTATS